MEVPGPAGRDLVRKLSWVAGPGGPWPVVPTVAGGPGAARAYERRSGRARKVGGGLRYRCQHRRDVPGAAGSACLLYTSDAADDLLCVDLGGRRIIKKKKN